MKKENKTDTEQVGKLPRFRILDVAILLLVVVAVVGIYFRYNILDELTNHRNLKEYTVSFSIDDIRYTTENYLHVNDTVYFQEDGATLGTLLTASEAQNRVWSTKPASKIFVGDDGTMEEVFYPNSESRVSATGRLLCTGSYSQDGGFCINGSRYLSAGQTVSVYTETVSFSITVTDIELAE